MNDTFQCGDSPALVTYLYGESEPSEHAVIEAHVEVCAACAAELAAMESTRVQLASWTPPAFGFSARRVAARALRPQAWWNRPLQPWLQAAAAAVIFAAGLVLGGVRPSTVARGALSFVEGRGTQSTAPAAVRAAGTGSAVQASAVSADELKSLEQRLRDEIAQVRLKPDTTINSQPGVRSVRLQPDLEGQLLARVRTLIDESEQRQHRELALRTAQIFRDFDSQRRVDLEQIHRSVGQIEGQTGAEVREQRQMLNYLMKVSEQR